MSTPDARTILETYVRETKVMQLATNTPSGPWISQMWFSVSFSPDLLFFTSNPIRNHSQHIAADSRVAVALLSGPPEKLGDPVRGVALRGRAEIVPDDSLESALKNFADRWPGAARWVTLDGIREKSMPNRLYRVIPEEWVLHDEVNFPTSPRQVIAPR